MSHQIVDMKCPGCGAPLDTAQRECKYCHNPVTITTFNSVSAMPMPMLNKYARSYEADLRANPDNPELNKSVAFCYLKLRLYDKALPAFEKAIESNFDDSESYFYAAICQLKGKKAFLSLRPAIDKAIEYINAATAIEPLGIYYYLLAYIKQDYFARKHLNTSPNWQEALQTAVNIGLSPTDVDQLYQILGVERPAGL